VGTHRQRFLDDLSTLVTLLTREAGAHSNDLVSSTCSLGSENAEKRSPTGVHDGFSKMVIFDHIEDTQVLNNNASLARGVLLGNLEMMVTPLASDLEMSLCSATCGLAASVTPLHAPGQLTLFASQGFLRGAIEAWVLDGMTLTIGEEDFEPDIDPDIGMLTGTWKMLHLWFRLTGNQRIPMPIGTMHQIDRLGLAFKRAMQLDLEEVTKLLGNNEVFLIFMQVHIFAILPELDGMPAVWLFEAGEPHIRNAQSFRRKKTFLGLGEPISEALYRRGRDMFTPTPFEGGIQGILARERPIVLILRLECSQHLIIEDARLLQASRELFVLSLIGIQAVLKHLHTSILMGSLEFVKRGNVPLRGAAVHPHA
jgi:hypothetical protein